MPNPYEEYVNSVDPEERAMYDAYAPGGYMSGTYTGPPISTPTPQSAINPDLPWSGNTAGDVQYTPADQPYGGGLANPTPQQLAQPINLTVTQDLPATQYFFPAPTAQPTPTAGGVPIQPQTTQEPTQPPQQPVAEATPTQPVQPVTPAGMPTQPAQGLQPPTGMIDTPQYLADMTWDARMQYLRDHPDVAQTELDRATNNAWYLSTQGQESPDQLRYVQAIQSLNTDQPQGEVVPPTGGAETSVTTEALSGIDVMGKEYVDAIKGFESTITDFEKSMSDIFGQYKKITETPFDITTSPQYAALQNWAKVQGDIASQQALEELNRRGIVNSTIAADRVAQIRAQVEASILPKLIESAQSLRQGELSNLSTMFGMANNTLNSFITLESHAFDQYLALQKQQIDAKEKEIDNAWESVKNLGYANNEAALTLGIAPGTPSFEAQKYVVDWQNKFKLARQNADDSMARIKAQATESMKRVQAQAKAAMARTQSSNAASMSRAQANIKAAADRAAAKTTSLRPKAVTLAQSDDRWLGATSVADKQQLIDEYLTLLSDNPGQDEVQSEIDNAKAIGATDEEIRDALIADGIDPSTYGF
ncbi:MAG: hypothetical protein ACYCX4_12945 [Bacillota bacterium]